jgi:hypothetical protein
MHERTPLIPRKRGQQSAAIKEFHDWVASRGCLACGGGATIHHVTGHADRPGRFSPDEACVAPLCPKHHQVIYGPKESVEALGHRGFFATYRIDLEDEADSLFMQFMADRRKAA